MLCLYARSPWRASNTYLLYKIRARYLLERAHKNLSENKFALIEMFQDKIMYILKMWWGTYTSNQIRVAGATVTAEAYTQSRTTPISLTHYFQLSFALNWAISILSLMCVFNKLWAVRLRKKNVFFVIFHIILWRKEEI